MAYNMLIVDDSRTVREIMKKILRLTGIEIGMIYEAANGQDGLRCVKTEWIDLVLADINMPVMNGVEMVRKMSEDGLVSTVPVIIVSTEGSTTRIEDLKSKGVRAYIRKPFTPEEIRDVINDVLISVHSVTNPKTIQKDLAILAGAICEVLSKYAMMFGEFGDKKTVFNEKKYFQSHMVYRGMRSSGICINADKEFCRNLASNVLGIENDDIKDENAKDALNELLNVTCGQYLTRKFGETPVFDLAMPAFSEIDSQQFTKNMQKSDSIHIKVDDLDLVAFFKE